MNPAAMNLAQNRFQAALTLGISTAPPALSKLLGELSTDSQFHVFDAEPIGHSISEEFPFLRNMLASAMSPNSADSDTWEAAIRWLLNSLRNWNSSEPNSLNKLRALLGAVTALDVNLAGLSSVAIHIASNQMNAGLTSFIENFDVSPAFNDRRFPDLLQQMESLAGNGNLERLSHMIPHINVFPAPDFGAAVVFMYNADPAALASVIERRNTVLFSLTICTVLGAQAIELASKTNNLIFKFVSVVNFSQDRSGGSTQSSHNTLLTLLLQIAKTSSTDWASCMQALFKFPGNNPTTLDSALAAALQQLPQEHWIIFFKALSLNHSHKAAAAVANILIPFANSVNAKEKTLRWTAAYQVWSDWNYCQHENNNSMVALWLSVLLLPDLTELSTTFGH